MMTKQTEEAIHKALKVLNCLNNDRAYETAWVKGAINACEEALEQPAQGSEQAPCEQPVAWMHSKERLKIVASPNHQKNGYTIPLYTHPCALARTAPSWQGLSDDEIHSLNPHGYTVMLDYKFARAIEQELKTKNGFSGLKEKNT